MNEKITVNDELEKGQSLNNKILQKKEPKVPVIKLK